VLAQEAVEKLAPLRNSLTLTSGKAMEPIWKASLLYKPATIALAEAYERLLERGSSSAGEVWEKGALTSFSPLLI
jgi:midasin